jgi:N6-adenosine-specific RNA methylase IME4
MNLISKQSLPALINGIVRDLEVARTIEDVCKVRDKADRLQRLSRGVDGARAAYNKATEVKLRAERRIGSELAKMDRAKQGRPKKGEAVSPFPEKREVVSPFPAPTLADLGFKGELGKKRAQHYQAIAAVPEEIFEAEIAAVNTDEAPELTTASVLRAARKVKRAAALEAVRSSPVMRPDGRYDVLVLDPPWPMDKIEREVRPNQVGFDYPTMSEDQLRAFSESVADMAADDCHLFMWTTQKFLQMALRLIDAYGFRYLLTMVWHKPGGLQPIGLPQYNCEFVIYARKGFPAFVDTKAFSCCFSAPRKEHSRKPDEFYDTVRRVTAGARIDVFSREPRDGFAQFGNEIKKFQAAG